MPELLLQVFLGLMKTRLPMMLLGGIDEAGRGPLAGPVTAAAVVLPPGLRISGLNDSKKLSEQAREELYEQICELAITWAVASLGPRVIEQVNILEAARRAMAEAAHSVCRTLAKRRRRASCYFLVDGNTPLVSSVVHETVVKGDSLLACISAASILAKVTRDREMKKYDRSYPGYGFAEHKGYGTKAHRERIKAIGPSAIHRRTFAGVREYL